MSPHPRDNPRHVIVELYDDADTDPQTVAQTIVKNMEDVKEAQPCYWDGFGHYVMVGERVTENVRLS